MGVTTPRNVKLAKFVEKNKNKFTIPELTKKFRVPGSDIWSILERRNLRQYILPAPAGRKPYLDEKQKEDNMSTRKRLAQQRRDQVKVEAQRHTEATLKEAMSQIDKMELELLAVKRIQKSRATFAIKPKKPSATAEATVITCFTDLHVGNKISLSQTNGINEYNVQLAYSRSATYFERVVRMTKKERQDVHIEELVLFLGGDFVDGALHMDTIMSNQPAAPMEQIVIAQEIIESGLQYLEKHGDFSKITIVCKDGNHGRVSAKLHWNSRTGNSLEWYMFYNLAKKYPQFNWVLEESFFTYLKVYDWTLRFHHGDTVAFGGQNGFYQNMHIKINGNNAAINADIDVMGHLHQYTALRRYVVNGSVVGFSPYGMALGSFNKGEPPTMAFFLLDKKRRMTVNIPILL